VANLLYHILRLVGVSPVRIIERKGIRYQVDLAEGIDLLLDENQESFYEDFLKLLTPIGYKVFDSVSRCQVTDENIRQIVPPGGSIDLVAVQLDSRN
jgi:hypothetical protein